LENRPREFLGDPLHVLARAPGEEARDIGPGLGAQVAMVVGEELGDHGAHVRKPCSAGVDVERFIFF